MFAYPAKPAIRILRRDGKRMPVVDVLELYTYLRGDDVFLKRAGKYPIFENPGLVKGKHFMEGITSFWITQEGFQELTEGSTSPKVKELSKDFSEANVATAKFLCPSEARVKSLTRYDGNTLEQKVLRYVAKILDKLFPDKPK